VVNTPTSTKVQQTNLVSDMAGLAPNTDPNLVNPWGIAFAPGGPFWISDNGTGKASIFDGAGAAPAAAVTIPSPTAPTGGKPTGQVFNGTGQFMLSNGHPATFIFATEDGTIVAWNSSGGGARVVADRSAIPALGGGSVYKGLAIGTNTTGSFLYAANFRTATVDVFDTNFLLVVLPGQFTDPNLPTGFAPFGIQNIGGDVFVAYAKQDAKQQADIPGAGNGLIDVFDSNGNFKRRLATGIGAGGALTTLNSPWGMTVAPTGFGALGGALLVGNFRDGRISAFNLNTGAFLGQLLDSGGVNPVAIPGLWGLAFGGSAAGSAAQSLYFTAGIGDPPTYTNNVERHGLFGSLHVVSP
jgi:uncharacterized protein (TIGR03118 family)